MDATTGLTASPEQWRKRGKTIALRDGGIFAVDMDGDGDPVLVLHGFPTSSWDFAAAATRLQEKGRRVILFDFLGFGFSDKPHDAAYSLFEQAEVAIGVARALGVKRAHLWAHDMGTSVATELLALRERDLLPFSIRSVTLMNGSVHIDMATPTLGQRLLKSPLGPAFARLSRKPVFEQQMRGIFAPKHPPSNEELDAMWSLLTRADGQLRLPSIIRYMEERTRFRRRWIGALERLDIPMLVAWGELDPVAKLAIGERLARETPGADLTTWDDLGHYPQVEAPDRVAGAVADFIARVEDGRASLTGESA
jgi:pimeloyl-ACP methyl ester carboxylesterase